MFSSYNTKLRKEGTKEHEEKLCKTLSFFVKLRATIFLLN